MNQKNSKTINEKGKIGKGFGFGDAMFNIKDLVSDYSQFSGNSQVVKEVEIKKNPIVKVVPNKPISASLNNKKPPVQTISKTVTQVQPSNLPKQVFKVPIGKQFTNSFEVSPLNVFQIVQNVYQLVNGKQPSRWEYNMFGDGVPANQIVEKPQINFNFNAQDFKQGSLGNCYFIAALASIAQHPHIFKGRIPAFKSYNGLQNEWKVYLFESGKLIQIIVDNTFQSKYTKPIGNNISPMILEKAYAQLYGNFQVLDLGHANDALRDLTGAPSVYLDFKDKNYFRFTIQQAFQNRFSLVISSKIGISGPINISPQHSYNILNYQMIGGQVFLKLRDPRGYSQPQTTLPFKLSSQKYQNGVFWIGQKELQSNFQVITISKTFKNYHYFYKAFSMKELTSKRSGIIIHAKTQLKAYITIFQKHKKFFDKNFSYDIIRLLIAQISTKQQNFKVIKTIKTGFNSQQACMIQVDLQPGIYIALGGIGHKKSKELYPNEIFTISVYSSSKNISFQRVHGNIDIKPFLLNYVCSMQHKGQFKQTDSDHGLRRYQGPLFGYICMVYENRGPKNIIETLEYTFKNVEITQNKIQLSPNQTSILIHPIGPENNCSHQISIKSKTIYK